MPFGNEHSHKGQTREWLVDTVAERDALNARNGDAAYMSLYPHWKWRYRAVDGLWLLESAHAVVVDLISRSDVTTIAELARYSDLALWESVAAPIYVSAQCSIRADADSTTKSVGYLSIDISFDSGSSFDLGTRTQVDPDGYSTNAADQAPGWTATHAVAGTVADGDAPIIRVRGEAVGPNLDFFDGHLGVQIIGDRSI